MHDAVTRLGRRAGLDPHFFAFALAEYAAAEGLDDPALAAFLGTTPAGLTPLRLCPAPRTDPEPFAADVDRLAAQFGLNRDAVAQIARVGQAVAVLRPDADAPSESVAPFLAARDQPPS